MNLSEIPRPLQEILLYGYPSLGLDVSWLPLLLDGAYVAFHPYRGEVFDPGDFSVVDPQRDDYQDRISFPEVEWAPRVADMIARSTVDPGATQLRSAYLMRGEKGLNLFIAVSSDRGEMNLNVHPWWNMETGCAFMRVTRKVEDPPFVQVMDTPTPALDAPTLPARLAQGRSNEFALFTALWDAGVVQRRLVAG